MEFCLCHAPIHPSIHSVFTDLPDGIHSACPPDLPPWPLYSVPKRLTSSLTPTPTPSLFFKRLTSIGHITKLPCPVAITRFGLMGGSKWKLETGRGERSRHLFPCLLPAGPKLHSHTRAIAPGWWPLCYKPLQTGHSPHLSLQAQEWHISLLRLLGQSATYRVAWNKILLPH